MECNYIPLSVTIDTDPKIWALDWEFGKDTGLGHWVHLLAIMYRAGGQGKLDMSNSFMVHSVASSLGFENAKELHRFLDACASLNLIDPLFWQNEQIVYSKGVDEQLQHVSKGFNQRREAARKSAESRAKKSKETGESG